MFENISCGVCGIGVDVVLMVLIESLHTVGWCKVDGCCVVFDVILQYIFAAVLVGRLAVEKMDKVPVDYLCNL